MSSSVKKSHVMINNGIIKNFFINIDNGNVWSLNLENLFISDKTGTNKFTLKRFFNQEDEKYLSENYESRIGIIIEKLIKNEFCELNAEEIQIIKDFLTALIVRNPEFYILFVIDYYPKIKFVNVDGEPMISFLKEAKERNFLKEYKIIIIRNKTALSFISSTYGFGMEPDYIKEFGYSFLIPVKPKIIIKIYKDKFNYLLSKNFQQISIDNIKDIERFNNCVGLFTNSMYEKGIFRNCENINNIFYLFSNQRNEIDRIKILIKDKRIKTGFKIENKKNKKFNN